MKSRAKILEKRLSEGGILAGLKKSGDQVDSKPAQPKPLPPISPPTQPKPAIKKREHQLAPLTIPPPPPPPPPISQTAPPVINVEQTQTEMLSRRFNPAPGMCLNVHPIVPLLLIFKCVEKSLK